MKKIYLLALAASTSVVASAQFKQNPATQGKLPYRNQPTTTAYDANANRAEIWSDTFSDCDNWVIQNANTDAGLTQYIAGINFECGTGLSPNGPASIDPISSTTAADGFMMVDSDEFGGPTPGTWVENCWFQTANPIDVTGETSLSLRFETFYRMWDNGSSDGNEYCLVEISTDGTTWPDPTTYEVAENTTPGTARFELWPTMETQDPVTNPTVKVFNFSSLLAGGDVTNIWIRFRWKGYYGYAWMIDDVSVFQTPDNDLTLGKNWVGDIINAYEYHAVPSSQAGEVRFGAEVANFGNLDQTSTVTFAVDGATYEVTETILAGTIDTVWTEPFNLPTAIGSYQVDVTLPDDEDPSGNSGVNEFDITEFAYGHNSNLDLFQRTFNSDQDVAFGNIYTINAETQAGGLLVLFGDASDAGLQAEVSIYEVLTNIQDLSQVANSGVFTVTQAMLDQGAAGEYTNLSFFQSGAALLEAGKSYIAEIRKFESTERLYIAANQYDDDFGTVNYGPFGTGGVSNWFTGWNFTPAVRVNLDPTISVNEVSAGDIVAAQVYPNPAQDNANISFNLLNSSNVNVIVRDITGRIVSTDNFGVRGAGSNQVSVNVSELNAGVYSVSLQAGNSVVTSQLVVR